MTKVILTLAIAGALLATAAFGQRQRVVGIPQYVDRFIQWLAWVDPSGEGPIYQKVRGAVAVKHAPSPSVRFVEPIDGGIFQGILAVEVDYWIIDPTQATSARNEFANGKRQTGIGHTHVWIYNQATRERVRFTGASGLLINNDTGRFESQPFELPPGTYKAFVTLQNHDHTIATPAAAPLLPPIDSVLFEVM